MRWCLAQGRGSTIVIRLMGRESQRVFMHDGRRDALGEILVVHGRGSFLLHLALAVNSDGKNGGGAIHNDAHGYTDADNAPA